MVDGPDTMDAVFHALSHEVRRDMVARLRAADLSVSQLAGPHPMSLEAASKHVRVLERAGLVSRRKVGRAHVCHLDTAPLAPATAWLAQLETYWGERLDELERVLTETGDAPDGIPDERPETTDDVPDQGEMA